MTPQQHIEKLNEILAQQDESIAKLQQMIEHEPSGEGILDAIKAHHSDTLSKVLEHRGRTLEHLEAAKNT